MSMGSRKTRKKRRSIRKRAELRELAANPVARNLFLFVTLFGSYGMALILALVEAWSLAAILFVLGSIAGGAIWIGQQEP